MRRRTGGAGEAEGTCAGSQRRQGSPPVALGHGGKAEELVLADPASWGMEQRAVGWAREGKRGAWRAA